MSDRIRSSRRTVCRTLVGLFAAIPASTVAGAQSTASPIDQARTDVASPELRRYVAVVDRIVDGEHAVLLLEQDGELVDQLVVSVTEFDEIAERDILLVLVKADELLAHWHLAERPNS